LISKGQGPVGADLARIEKRRSELVAARMPTDPDLIVPRISRLFLRFPSARIENPAATTSAYAADLASFPLWAIEAGIMALLRGHGLSNRDFAPSSVVVRDAVVREIARVDAELTMIDRLLTAKEKPAKSPDADKRAEALQNAMAFVGGARMQAEEDRKRRHQMTEAELSQARQIAEAIDLGKPDPRPPPSLSPELRAMLAARGALRPEKPAEEDVA
jgi:hypothetical protein